MKLYKFFKLLMVSFVLFLLIFITNQKIFGENWIIAGSEEGTTQFFDKESITEVSPSAKRILTKSIIPLEVRLKQIENHGLPIIGYSFYSHTMSLWEINCNNQTYGVLYFIDYDKEGSEIDSFKFNNPEVDFIIPGSMVEKLCKAICP